MNPRYGTQNAPTSILKLLYVSTHIISFHFCLIYVECFRFIMTANIDLFEAGLNQVCSWLATCLRPGLQLARVMECSLYGVSRRLKVRLHGPDIR